MRQADLPLVHLGLLQGRLPAAAVFSGRTAAWLHGLDVPPCDPVEVTLPRLATTSRRAGVALMRSDLAAGEIIELHDLRATSSLRTIADLARRLPLTEAVVILDMALHRRMVDVEQLNQWAAAHRGYHGLRRLKRALDLAEARAESPMETRLRLLLVSSGLPRPAAQVSLYDETGGFLARPDLYYPSDHLAIEYDGASHRTTLAADNRRQNRILEAGYRLLRFTAVDVLHNPVSVVGQVRRALRHPRAARCCAAGL
jgi:hypothetical protein